MSEPNSSSSPSPLSTHVATGKELVGLLRDAVLLLLVILLIVWPRKVNDILVDAGFTKGSFGGLEWQANLKHSDESLLKAQALIADLSDQNKKLNQALAQAQPDRNNPQVRATLSQLERIDTQLTAKTATVQAAVASNISANSPLVQQAQTAADKAITWGVVYGGDQTLAAAEYEVRQIAPKLGLGNAATYLRQGSYRSVATATDRLQADQLLQKAQERRRDAYLVNMSTWCPGPVPREGYFDCPGP